MKIIVAVIAGIAGCIITGIVVNAMNAPEREAAKRWHQHCAEVEAAARVEQRAPESLQHRLQDSPIQEFAKQCKQ
jgi:hypothetical protein